MDSKKPVDLKRRDFIRKAAEGTAIVALGGGLWYLGGDHLTREARAQTRKDGRKRLPKGQRVLRSLRPMGGQEGDPRRGEWKLKVHGEVDKPFELGFRDLLAMDNVDQDLDVHCVTGWSVLGATWTGVRIADLAARAGVNDTARHVIFEAAHGYTANVPLGEALHKDCMVAHRLDGQPLQRENGAPVRAVIPDLYFWKSAKWLTGIKFVRYDQPGYWEVRGYHNHADPWKEERYG